MHLVLAVWALCGAQLGVQALVVPRDVEANLRDEEKQKPDSSAKQDGFVASAPVILRGSTNRPGSGRTLAPREPQDHPPYPSSPEGLQDRYGLERRENSRPDFRSPSANRTAPRPPALQTRSSKQRREIGASIASRDVGLGQIHHLRLPTKELQTGGGLGQIHHLRLPTKELEAGVGGLGQIHHLRLPTKELQTGGGLGQIHHLRPPTKELEAGVGGLGQIHHLRPPTKELEAGVGGLGQIHHLRPPTKELEAGVGGLGQIHHLRPPTEELKTINEIHTSSPHPSVVVCKGRGSEGKGEWPAESRGKYSKSVKYHGIWCPEERVSEKSASEVYARALDETPALKSATDETVQVASTHEAPETVDEPSIPNTKIGEVPQVVKNDDPNVVKAKPQTDTVQSGSDSKIAEDTVRINEGKDSQTPHVETRIARKPADGVRATPAVGRGGPMINDSQTRHIVLDNTPGAVVTVKVETRVTGQGSHAYDPREIGGDGSAHAAHDHPWDTGDDGKFIPPFPPRDANERKDSQSPNETGVREGEKDIHPLDGDHHIEETNGFQPPSQVGGNVDLKPLGGEAGARGTNDIRPPSDTQVKVPIEDTRPLDQNFRSQGRSDPQPPSQTGVDHDVQSPDREHHAQERSNIQPPQSNGVDDGQVAFAPLAEAPPPAEVANDEPRKVVSTGEGHKTAV